MECVEGHDAVADDDGHEVDCCAFISLVPEVDLDGEVGYVLSGIGLPRDEEPSSLVLRKLLEEVDDSLERIIRRVVIIVFVFLVQVVGIPHSCW